MAQYKTLKALTLTPIAPKNAKVSADYSKAVTIPIGTIVEGTVTDNPVVECIKAPCGNKFLSFVYNGKNFETELSSFNAYSVSNASGKAVTWSMAVIFVVAAVLFTVYMYKPQKINN